MAFLFTGNFFFQKRELFIGFSKNIKSPFFSKRGDFFIGKNSFVDWINFNFARAKD
jgi:hypothetical protein